jgi:hypothetical protein
LLLLLQLRPIVPGLFESFAHCCGGVQGGASWILKALVDSPDDLTRSLGIRSIAAYLDVTSRGADLPLSLGSLLQASSSSSDVTHDVSSTVRRASTRISQLAKGLASSGTNVRSAGFPSSKLTSRVVFKVCASCWRLAIRFCLLTPAVSASLASPQKPPIRSR